MSREIKFRAWDKEFRKMWWGGFYLSFNPLGMWAETEDGPEEVSLKYFEIMQYTGLRDRNGVEIYEGDIIKGIYQHVRPKEIALIYWDEKEAGFIAHWQDDDSRMGISEFFKKIEVIGNIYEHKHLLEAKDE